MINPRRRGIGYQRFRQPAKMVRLPSLKREPEAENVKLDLVPTGADAPMRAAKRFAAREEKAGKR
jgi:hypothetical protein